jgi:hypothetical protein
VAAEAQGFRSVVVPVAEVAVEVEVKALMPRP